MNNEIASLCSQFVQVHSVKEVAALVKDYLSGCGASIQVYEPRPDMINVIARVTYGKGPTIILCGHLDTYTAVHVEKWKYPPFSGKVIDVEGIPIVFGRGSTDMKGGIVGLLSVLHEIERHHFDGTLLYVFTPDEEIGSRYGAEWLVSNRMIEGDACIIAEPTALLFYSLGEKGIYKAYLSEDPPKELYSAIGDFCVKVPPELKEIATAATQYFKNVLAEPLDSFFSACTDMAGMKDFYIGIPHGSSLYEVECVVQNVLSKKGVVPDVYDARTPNFTSHSHNLCKALETAAYKITGRLPHPLITVGSSDASFFRKAGIPCVLYGPGEPLLSHQPNEWVHVKKVAQLTRVVSRTAASMCGEEGSP